MFFFDYGGAFLSLKLLLVITSTSITNKLLRRHHISNPGLALETFFNRKSA